MRNISFALTTEQIRSQTKTVTRRLGCKWLNAGTLLQPVVKGQGIPKGGTVERIGAPIRVVSVRRELLSTLTDDPAYGASECVREGFLLMLPDEFVEMFSKHNGCNGDTDVSRIEFEYTEPLT